jgi:YD repeat-containing protein
MTLAEQQEDSPAAQSASPRGIGPAANRVVGKRVREKNRSTALLGAWICAVVLTAHPPLGYCQANDDDDSIVPLLSILYAKDQPPNAVQITSPANGAQLVNDTPYSLVAAASDPDGPIRSVAFYANGGSTPICASTQSASPFSCSYSFPVNGPVALTAKAVDNFGKTLTSAVINVVVVPPSVRQYVYDAQGRLTGVIAANGDAARYVYDPVGNITRIERFANSATALLGAEPAVGAIGSSVTVSGIGFSTTPSQNTVQFNGVTGSISSATANQIVVTIPTGATTGPLSITTPSGSDTAAGTFVVQSPAPVPTISGLSANSGPVGQTVTINGANLVDSTGGTEVKFNGIIATVTSATATSISTTVPGNATTGYITVRNNNGSAQSSTRFTVALSGLTVTATETAVIDGNCPSACPSISVVNSPSGKVGVVLFDGTVGKNVGVGVTNVSGNGSSITVLRPDGQTLPPTTVASPPGTVMTLPPLPLSGTYSIVFAPAPGVTAGATFTLSTPLQQTLSVNGSASINSTRPGQGARYSFTGNVGQGYGITLQGTGASNNPTLAVYQAGGATLYATTTITSSGPAVATPPALTGGDFAVFVNPTSTTALANLTLAVWADSTGSITYGSGNFSTVSVDQVGRAGLFAFTLSTPSIVNFYISPTLSVPSTATIFDANGNVVPRGTLAPAGNYSLLANPTNYSTGSIAIQLGVADLRVKTLNIGTPITRHPTPQCPFSINGYYELENVGSIHAQNSWIDVVGVTQQADGSGSYWNVTQVSWTSASNDIPPNGTLGYFLQGVPFTYQSFFTGPGPWYIVVKAAEYGALIDQDRTNNAKTSQVTFSSTCQ